MNLTALTWPCHDLPVAWRVPAEEIPFPLIAAPSIRPDAFVIGYGVEAGFEVLAGEPGR